MQSVCSASHAALRYTCIVSFSDTRGIHLQPNPARLVLWPRRQARGTPTSTEMHDAAWLACPSPRPLTSPRTHHEVGWRFLALFGSRETVAPCWFSIDVRICSVHGNRVAILPSPVRMIVSSQKVPAASCYSSCGNIKVWQQGTAERFGAFISAAADREYSSAIRGGRSSPSIPVDAKAH